MGGWSTYSACNCNSYGRFWNTNGEWFWIVNSPRWSDTEKRYTSDVAQDRMRDIVDGGKFIGAVWVAVCCFTPPLIRMIQGSLSSYCTPVRPPELQALMSCSREHTNASESINYLCMLYVDFLKGEQCKNPDGHRSTCCTLAYSLAYMRHIKVLYDRFVVLRKSATTVSTPAVNNTAAVNNDDSDQASAAPSQADDLCKQSSINLKGAFPYSTFSLHDPFHESSTGTTSDATCSSSPFAVSLARWCEEQFASGWCSGYCVLTSNCQVIWWLLATPTTAYADAL